MRASNERIERGLKSGCWPGDWTTCTSVRFAFPPASASRSQTRLSVSVFFRLLAREGQRSKDHSLPQTSQNQPPKPPANIGSGLLRCVRKHGKCHKLRRFLRPRQRMKSHCGSYGRTHVLCKPKGLCQAHVQLLLCQTKLYVEL